MRLALLLAFTVACKSGDQPPPESCTPSPEVCDGVDNDCDGVADEGLGERYYADADQDGFGNPRIPKLTCTPPEGWVLNPYDCNDANPLQNPTAVEICNGEDDNCNGAVDEGVTDGTLAFTDADRDGFGDPSTGVPVCEVLAPAVADGTDCDDTNAAIFPSAVEHCDGVDNNCDGLPDNHAVEQQLLFVDADGDTYGAGAAAQLCPGPNLSATTGDCDDSAPSVHPGANELPVDGIDSDCDGLEDCYEDFDLDGVGSSAPLTSADLSCTTTGVSPTHTDCDDTNALSYPGNTEVCGNGLDDDCDPLTLDSEDADGDGISCEIDCDDSQPPSAPIQFRDIAADAGIDVLQGQVPAGCEPDEMAGGAAIADIDDDGDLDLFLPRLGLSDQLFLNNGNGTFSEQSAAWGLNHTGTSGASVFFDADGDGDLDLFVLDLGGDGNRLYIRSGATFSDEATTRGVFAQATACSKTFSVSVADVDGDGDLDLHTTAWEKSNGPENQLSRLYRNDGTGHFSAEAIIPLDGLASFTSAFADFDEDGDLDVAVTGDWGRSSLWSFSGLSYAEVTVAAGVGTEENGMGSAVADVDGDGHLDWFVTSIYDGSVPCSAHWGCSGNRLYLGSGDLQFTDHTDAGVRDGGWAWGAAFFDYDNDGDLDLGAENGFNHPLWSNDFTRLWEQDDSFHFVDVACDTNLASIGQGRNFLPFDYDRDGDQDVLLVHNGEPLRLMESTGVTGHWVTIKLAQSGANSDAIGAQIWLRPAIGDTEVRRDIHLNSQFGATNAPEAHYGLGSFTGTLNNVRVRWPDGVEESYTGVSIDSVVTLTRTL